MSFVTILCYLSDRTGTRIGRKCCSHAAVSGLSQTERLPYQYSGNIIHIEGKACDLKRDVKCLGSGVRKKGYSTFWGKK